MAADDSSVMPRVVTGDDEAQDLAKAWSGVASLALDVEGDGLFRYRARLCTVQLASEDATVVIDTLAVSDRSALAALLGPHGPRKILHDVSYDARLLYENGVVLGNVFDTALAARFLGEKSTGLAALIEKRFGVHLPKEQQQSDWGRRPFNERDLSYLAADVHYLRALGEQLESEARAAGIHEEVRLEIEYLLERALEDPPEPPPPWARIKGRDTLDDTSLAVLRELADLREEAARQWDVPPFKVTGNAQLLEMARRRPRSGAELSQIRGLGRGRAARLTGRFLGAIRKGESRGKVPDDERAVERRPRIPSSERDTRKRRQQALTTWRRAEAESRGVDVQVVLPGHCLNDLVDRGASTADELRAVRGLGECRVQRYGEALLGLLSKLGA